MKLKSLWFALTDSVGPLWYGWGPGWGYGGGRDYWGAYPTPDFITHYTGRVVA
jgi:hypothetical protein